MKRQRRDSSPAEARTFIVETPEPFSTIEKITNSPDNHSILIHVRKEACYRVSKHVLNEVPWFRNFFSEQQESSTYHLPNADPTATRILFLILHQQPQRLPALLFLPQLVDLALICDKYHVAEIVLPHVEIQKWVEHLWTDSTPREEDWVAWIKILRRFYPMEEQCDRLSTVLDVMAANISKVEKHWIFQWSSYTCKVTDIDDSDLFIVDLSCQYNPSECPRKS
jgi:hypothetical protein